MERFSVKTFTSAWAKYYAASVKGTWVPTLGAWYEGAWHATDNKLVDAAILNPAQLVLLVQERTREEDTVVTVSYKTATLSSWAQEVKGGYRQYQPVYTYAEDKSCEITIPKFTDSETIYLLPDNNVYQIDSVTVSGGAGRNQEKFSIMALASPTPRILYGLGINDIMANLLRLKRGLFAQPDMCMTCMGLKTVDDETCPECGGYGYSGPNATYPLLDFHGRNVGLSRYATEEDEPYGRRVWARKWNLIPTKSEMTRYFMHFMHILNADDFFVWEQFDDDEPLFWVAANYRGLGDRALWQQGDAFQDYDGMVERACPAGVNGYFAWMIPSFDDGVDGEVDELDFIDETSEQPWMLEGGSYGATWEEAEWDENLWQEFEDWCMENFIDDFEGYDDDDDIATERPDLWELLGGSFVNVNTNVAGDPHDFEWHDVGTFVPEDDPRELWEPHGILAAETFSNYTPPEDITGGQWTIVGTNVNNTFKAIVYYGAVFSKADTGVATDFKFTFVDSHDMSHKGWFDGDGVRITGICTSYSDMQYAVTRADGTDMMCVRYNSSDNKIEILSDATWIDSGMITYLSGEDTIDMYYQSETTFIVVINGSPIGGSTPTEFTNKAGASWAGGNCASVHFSCPTAGTASMYFSAIMTTWEQSAGDAYNGTFAIQEHTYGGATHRMLEIAWNGLRDNNQEMRVQFPAPIATLSNHVVEFDWMTGGINYQHFLRFYNANGDCIQEIDGYNSTFYLLSEFTNESSGSWQECDFTPVLDTVSYSKYYRIRLTFIDNTHFKIDVYDYATSTWHMGGDLTYADSTTAANLDHMSFCRQTTNSMHFHVADLTLSWLPLTEAVVGTSVGELKFATEDGEAVGTFPVPSGEDFNDYRVKLDVAFSGAVEDYPLEVGVAEDGNEDDDDLNIHLAFRNDRLIYNRWGVGFTPGSNSVETFITWTAGTAITGTGEAGEWSVEAASGEDQYIRAADFNMGGGSSRCMFVKDGISYSGGVKGTCFFTDASPQTPSATYQYIVEFDLYIDSGSPGQISIGQGNPTKTMLCLLYFAGDNDVEGPASQDSTLNWAVDTHYVVQIWIISATQFKVSLDGGSTWSVAMNNYLSASWSGPCTYFEVYSTYTLTGQSYIDNVCASWMNITEVPAEEDSTGIYWCDPDPDGKVVVEAFDGFPDMTRLDDSDDWAPFTGDDSYDENCYAWYYKGRGKFFTIGGYDANKMYTLSTGPSSGTCKVFCEVEASALGLDSTFVVAVGTSASGGIPAAWLVLKNDATSGFVAHMFTGATFKDIDISMDMAIIKLQFVLDMDAQAFKVYQKEGDDWILRVVEDDYEDFWNPITTIDLMLFQLDNVSRSTVYVDNIATDWDTPTYECDDTFEVSIISDSQFRFRKGDGNWTYPMDCKNAFAGPVEKLKLKTPEAGGVQVDDIGYSW